MSFDLNFDKGFLVVEDKEMEIYNELKDYFNRLLTKLGVDFTLFDFEVIYICLEHKNRKHVDKQVRILVKRGRILRDPFFKLRR